MNKTQEKIESRALRASAWGYLFMALLGGLFFYLARSEAILLDGIYSFISLLMTFLAQRVSLLVHTPYTDSFHFGFAHFEPLLNVVRILLILAITGFATVSAIVALLSGGRALNADTAVIYGLVAAAGCLAMAWRQRRASRQATSPILAVDAHNWLIDGVLSSGVAVTFFAAYLLRSSAYADWIAYVDPLLVIVMVALLLPTPLKSLGENLREVLMQAPSPEMQAEIRQKIVQAVEPVAEEQLYIRMLPVGRFLYLQVHILLPADAPLQGIEECDRVRERIHEGLKELHPRLTLDVVFTADERWLGLEMA
ncbi:MAG: cation diffusion facilitator family transporter [Pseudomonadota bacterium]|nr:cation diffusion facilitator family transporter [Pseudomonadota bacterium]